MRLRHNKKRNTAFLYEALIREVAKSVVNKDDKKKQQALGLVKEYFMSSSEIAKELQLYKCLLETTDMDIYTAEKLIQETKKDYDELDHEQVFMEQSRIISFVNKNLSRDVFSNFVPNYKDYATIAQIFSKKTAPKKRVLLEESLLKKMTHEEEELREELVPITNLIYKTFVEKYNKEYGEQLLEEQRNLLTNYILSFSNNGLNLKLYLNEEITRIKNVLHESLEIEEIKNDKLMTEKTNKVLGVIDTFREKPLTQDMVKQILKIQNLTHEITK